MEEIHHLVVNYSRSQPSQLFQLLETFPSGLAVWLARKAGEAYEAGAFWEKFARPVASGSFQNVGGARVLEIAPPVTTVVLQELVFS